MSIHVNAGGKKFKTDKRPLNMGENATVFPLCQIIIPSDANYLDEYNHNKYSKPLEVEIHNPIGSLNFIFWIHPPEKYIALNDLPLINKLKEVANTIVSRKFVHGNLKKYTCTLFISDLGVREKVENNSPNIITSVWNDEQPYIFELAPKY